MKKRDILFFMILLIFFILSIKSVYSVSVGVSPGVINFDNMLKGGYAEKTLTVTIATTENILVNASTRGEVSEWINLSAYNFTVSINNPYELTVVVQPPLDIPNGDYSGYLRIITEGLGNINTGEMGNIVKAAIDVIINVRIVDAEIIECRAFQFSVDSVEQNEPINFRVKIANDGNTRLYPNINIDIWDQEQQNIVKFIDFNNQMVLPTTTKELVYKVPSEDLDIDQYWAEIEAVECYSKDLLTFDILEPGSLISSGILTEISNQRSAYVNDKVLIMAVFKNTGQKTVLARFKGNIQYKNNVIEILESDEFEVKSNEVTNFTVYFTPKKAGRYIITGRVFYDKKRTYELSSHIDVMAVKKNYTTLIYIAIIVVIALLIYLIRKERKKRKF